MTIVDRETAARRAEASHTNRPGTCQLWTRELYNAPSVGDVDHDGDADAVDGWKKETQKHPADRNPPRGVPLAWSGGSHGFGHRAISLGGGMVRSIDVAGSGKVGTVHLGWFETHWNMHYSGWSSTISGLVIPTGNGKTINQIAREVIAGEWGDGGDRKARLTRAGYNPITVQAEVNRILK